eukprot:402426-Amphidinium_carterae.1
MVDISNPRILQILQNGRGQGTIAPVGAMPMVLLLGTPRSESAGQVHQTVARWGMELEVEMRQVPGEHEVVRAEHNAQTVRVRQSVALRALRGGFNHPLALPMRWLCSATSWQSHPKCPGGSPWVPNGSARQCRSGDRSKGQSRSGRISRVLHQEGQNYMSESSTYLTENVQLQQRLQQMTELNQHTGAVQATSH